MKDLLQILLEPTYQNSREEYERLCRELEEAVRLPAPESGKPADPGETPCPEAGARDPREPGAPPTPEELASLLDRRLRNQARTDAPPLYEVSRDPACGTYGILARSKGLTASFPSLTEDAQRVEGIVQVLCRYGIPLELFKDYYLSGRLQKHLSRHTPRK